MSEHDDDDWHDDTWDEIDQAALYRGLARAAGENLDLGLDLYNLSRQLRVISLEPKDRSQMLDAWSESVDEVADARDTSSVVKAAVFLLYEMTDDEANRALGIPDWLAEVAEAVVAGLDEL